MMKSNNQDTPKTLTQSAIRFGSGTFLSRIGGLLRDMSMAFFFGTDPAIAAFLVAFRLANLLRRIFGEGALLNSFVPHFESHRETNPKQAAQFFRDILFSLALVLFLLIGVIELICFFWVIFGGGRPDNQEIVILTMIMLPGLLFICLFSLCSGLLQCEKSFFLSGVAPLIFNVVWIGSIWMFKDIAPSSAVRNLSFAVTFAFLFQWLMLLPKTFLFLRSHLTWIEFFQGKLFSSEIRQMISSMSMTIVGVGAVQINSAVDAVFARYASLEGPAYLNYAIHLQQLPLALFGIGISTALLPPLARAIKDLGLYAKLLQFALSNAILLLFPCCIAIFVLGSSGINLLYGRGDFNNESVTQTTLCLWGYGIGLIPMGIALLLAPAFYARKDYWTPTIASFISLGINFVLNILFVLVFQRGAASLSLATSLAACCSLFFLWSRFSKITGIKIFLPVVLSSWRIALCSGIAGIITLIVAYMAFDESILLLLFGTIGKSFSRDFISQVIHFFTLSGTFVFSFLALYQTTAALVGLEHEFKFSSAITNEHPKNEIPKNLIQ